MNERMMNERLLNELRYFCFAIILKKKIAKSFSASSFLLVRLKFNFDRLIIVYLIYIKENPVPR